MKRAVFAARRGVQVVIAYTETELGEGLLRSVALDALDWQAAEMAVEAINAGLVEPPKQPGRRPVKE